MWLDFCCHCDDYPCSDLAAFIGDKWPHHWTMEPNLEFIRSQGVAKWLEAQRRQWSCPKCGAEIVWYQKMCACGHELDAFDVPEQLRPAAPAAHKSEYRNTKCETSSNDSNSEIRNGPVSAIVFRSLACWGFVLVSDFGIRISCFKIAAGREPVGAIREPRGPSPAAATCRSRETNDTETWL